MGYWLYQVYKFLFWGPLLVLVTGSLGIVLLVIAWVSNPRRASETCAVPWARIMTRATPVGVSVTGREHIDPDQSYIVVSNHQSHFDIFIIYGFLGIDLRWVMKKELRKVPIIGICGEALGCVFVDRSNRASAIRSIQEARERISHGTSLIFFPEGTRSRTDEMLPFKKGAFRTAMDLDLPILPVTVRGTRAVLPADTIDLRPGNAEMIIHEPIPTAGLPDDAVDDLLARVREVIAAPLKAADAAAPAAPAVG